MSVIAVQNRSGRVRSFVRPGRPRIERPRQLIGPMARQAGQPRPLTRPLQPGAPSAPIIPFVVGGGPAARNVGRGFEVPSGTVAVDSTGWTLTDRGRLVILAAFVGMVLLAIAVVIGQFLAVSADPLSISAASLASAGAGTVGG